MTRLLATACTVAVALLAASCAQKAGNDATKEGNVAVVDGQSITRSMFNEYVALASSQPNAQPTEQQRQALLEDLIRAQVIAADAEATGITKSERAVARLELARLNAVGEATIAHFKETKATDAELRAEYDKKVAALGTTEYRASHILVASEDLANQILAQLKTGGNFGALARKYSTDASNKDKGGDLDWFSPNAMTPSFAQALLVLKKGETTPAPVQTEFGWHLIWLMDTRPAVAPPFESVKDLLTELVENKKFKAYVDGLVAKAKITKSL